MSERAPRRTTPPGPTVLALPVDEFRDFPGARLVGHAVRLTLIIMAGLAIAAVVAAALLRVEVAVQGAGSLQPAHVWQVRASAAGVVRATYVGNGERVESGQRLLQLDTVQVAEEQEQLATQIMLRQLAYQRSLLAADYDRAQSENSVLQARASLIRARARLQERLLEFGLQGDVDSVLSTFRPGGHIALDLAVADVLGADAQLRTAALQGRRAELASLATRESEAEVHRLEKLRGVTRRRTLAATLSAPAEGVVLVRDIEQLNGRVVQAGETVLKVFDPSSWLAIVDVPEFDIHRIRRGDKAGVGIPALSALHPDPFGGRVIDVVASDNGDAEVPRGAAAPGGFRVIIALDRAPLDSLGLSVLHPGYSVEARISGRRTSVLMLLTKGIGGVLHRRRG